MSDVPGIDTDIFPVAALEMRKEIWTFSNRRRRSSGVSSSATARTGSRGHRGLLEAQWEYIASLEGFDPDTGDYLDWSGRAQLSLSR
jgi:hypothetical protein